MIFRYLPVLASILLSACASSFDTVRDTSDATWPVKLQVERSASSPTLKVLDVRPQDQRAFKEFPTAAGAYAILGDAAIDPGPAEYVGLRLAQANIQTLHNKEIRLTRFTADVTYRSAAPNSVSASAALVVPMIVSGPAALGAIAAFSARRYQYIGLESLSSIEVNIWIELDAVVYIAKAMIPFERRLVAHDVGNAIKSAADNLVRQLPQ